MVSVDRMLISILSVSVEVLEMSCAVVAEALEPRAWDLKADDLHQSLVSDVQPQESKLVLYPILMFHHLLQGLSRLCLGRLSVMCPFLVKPDPAHLDRQVATVGKEIDVGNLPLLVS